MLKDKSTCTRLTEEMRGEVEKYAELHDLTVAQVVRKAVKMFLANLKEHGEKEVV